MVHITYFVIPSGLAAKGLEKIGSKASDFLPVVGPFLNYSKRARKVTNMANPVAATARGIATISDFCFGKTTTLSIECLLWLGFSVAGGLTANPFLIAAGADMGNLVLDEILED